MHVHGKCVLSAVCFTCVKNREILGRQGIRRFITRHPTDFILLARYSAYLHLSWLAELDLTIMFCDSDCCSHPLVLYLCRVTEWITHRKPFPLIYVYLTLTTLPCCLFFFLFLPFPFSRFSFPECLGIGKKNLFSTSLFRKTLPLPALSYMYTQRYVH